MNKFILRASALASAAALSGMIACGSTSGCGQTTQNPVTSAPAPTTGVVCGAGTTAVTTATGIQCTAPTSH